MQELPNPNKFTQVKLLSNPLKSITCRHTFTNQETIAECKLFPELLDLGCGVWQLAVQSVIIKNLTQGKKLNSIFDLKTNLSSSYKQVENSAVAVNETLCSVPVKLDINGFNFYDPSTKIFFTLNNRPNDRFRVYFFENEMFQRPTSPPWTLEVEIRLLFQRML